MFQEDENISVIAEKILILASIHIINMYNAGAFPNPQPHICTHIFKVWNYWNYLLQRNFVWFKSIYWCNSKTRAAISTRCPKEGWPHHQPHISTRTHAHTHLLHYSSLSLIICLCFSSPRSSPSFLSSPVPICEAIKSSYGEILVIQEGQAERSRRESVKWMKPND